MSEPLKYDMKFRRILGSFPALADDLNVTYDETFLRYHNHACPNCKEPMKIRDGEVKNVGTISLCTLSNVGYAVSYALCKPCAKKVEKLPQFIWVKEAVKIEEYLVEMVPRFKTTRENKQ